MEDIYDKLTAGKEGVCGEFPGTDCYRGRVILEGEKMSERHRRTSSIIQIRRDTSSAFDTVFAQTDTDAYSYWPYELYRTILTAMVSSCGVLFLYGGCRPRCTVPLTTNVEIWL